MEYFNLVQQFYETYSMKEINRLKKIKIQKFQQIDGDIKYMNYSDNAIDESTEEYYYYYDT